MNSYLRKQLPIVACLYLGQTSVGYLAWSSPVIAKLQNPDETPLPHLITDTQGSWLGSLSLPGATTGAIISGWISNTFGRKPSLLLGGMTITASYLLLSTADEFWMVMVGRYINGVGVGVLHVMNMTYIAEISSTNIRGTFLTAIGIFSSLGILLSFVVGTSVQYVRVMYTGFCLAMAFCVGALFIPETPAFLVLKGKEIEAKTTLVALARSNDIVEVLAAKQTRFKSLTQGWKDMFLVKSNRKAMFIGFVLIMCQQMSGFVPMMLFSTTIFQSVNSSIDPGVATIVIGVTQLLSSCSTPLFIERAGRKKLLLVSSSACSVSLAVLGIYFYLESSGHESAKNLHWLPLLCLITFLIGFNSGFCTIPAACMNEMFDSSARGPGSSLVLSIGTIISFTVAVTFGYMTSAFGSHVAFWIYAGACAFACGFTSVFVVETKGKSLAEVQLLLSK